MKLKENNSPLVSNYLQRFIQFLSHKKSRSCPNCQTVFLCYSYMPEITSAIVQKFFLIFLVGLERYYYNREEIELYMPRRRRKIKTLVPVDLHRKCLLDKQIKAGQGI